MRRTHSRVYSICRTVGKCRRASTTAYERLRAFTSVVSQERNGEKREREHARARALTLSFPPSRPLALSLSFTLSRSRSLSLFHSIARSSHRPYFSSLSLSRSFSLTRSLFLAASSSAVSPPRNAQHSVTARYTSIRDFSHMQSQSKTG